MNESLYRLKLSLSSLTVYRRLLEDQAVQKLMTLAEKLSDSAPGEQNTLGLYSDFFYTLSKAEPGLSLARYIQNRIYRDENIFSLAAEIHDYDTIDEAICEASSSDLANLEYVCALSPAVFKEELVRRLPGDSFYRQTVSKLPQWIAAESKLSGVQELAAYYRQNGCGIFSGYKAFLWNHTDTGSGLMGIEQPDPIRISQLIGYDSERSEVLQNTQHFINGFPANNVLLYGDRGTGKSSTVKALLNEYHTSGLRLIEVPKKHLMDFPEIIRLVRGRNLKFIIFVDDLAFEDNEESYTALKAVLEGGVESKPENVLIYATSNRRHLIKEKFSDRLGLQSSDREDEIRAADTIQEKLSLSDRFGITVVFSSPDKARYLQIVRGLAEQRGLDIDPETLEKEAMKWELWYNGRSPRTARQFVDWLSGESGKSK